MTTEGAPGSLEVSGNGAFAAFLGGTQGAGPWRSLSVLAAAALHVLAAVLAIGFAAWKVEELEVKPKVILTFTPRAIPASSAPPAPAPARQQARPTGRRPARLQPSTRPAIAPPPTAGNDQTDPDAEVGPASSELPCPPGATCTDAPSSAPRMLPPQVGEKRCLACPLPSLPEAFRRIGTVVSVLARICADATGRTTKVDILRGLSPEADRKVVEVLASWRFSPLLLDGRPVPFCYATRFVFSSQ